jgi:hypothetical protein
MRPSPGTLFLLVMFGALVLRASTVLGLDSDYGLHCAYGRALLAHGPWLPEDPTIYTAPGQEPVLHEWGAEALFAALRGLFGAWGPVRLVALLAALVPWWLYRRTLAATGSFWPAMAAWVLGGLGVATGLLVRPHVFSVAAFCIGLELLARWREDRAPVRLRWLALLLVLWTNLHGGGALVLGAVLLAAYTPAAWRSGARGLPALYALTLINPWGPRLHLHVAHFLLGPGPRAAADMGPPDLRTGTLVVLAIFLVALALGLRRLRPVNAPLLAVTLATLAMACMTMRALPFLGIALGHLLPPVIARWLADTHPAADQRSRLLAAGQTRSRAALVGLALFCLLPLGRWLAQPEVAGPRVPGAAISWLRAHPEVSRLRGYAGYDDSGYLLEAGVVDRVYLHALNANTPPWLADDERLLAAGAPSAVERLTRHDVRWALLAVDAPLATRLAETGWRPLWQGGARALYHAP